MRSRQRGAFLMARALLLVCILLAMLIIPVWIKRGNDDKMNAGAKAEQAKNTGATPVDPVPASPSGARSGPASADASATLAVQTLPTDSAAAAGAPRQIGHGLTFALAPVRSKASEDQANLTHLSCHGEPRQVDQPHRDSCNPYKGDTSCRVVLPVLCFQSKGLQQPPDVQAGQYQGWSGGVLGATQPVMGAVLASEAAATARCEKELGAGWRMAEFHDAGGWGMQGQRGMGLAPNTRFWVHINDQPGNCWNSTP
jgi:hypothetical protein